MTDDDVRYRLTERIQHLPAERLVLLEQLLAQLEGADSTPPSRPAQAEVRRTSAPLRHWPRAPVHRLSEHGTFMVTAGTLYKDHHLSTCSRLDVLQSNLLELAGRYGWHLEAWAVFSNHYHFVGHSQATSAPLNDFLGNLHKHYSECR